MDARVEKNTCTLSTVRDRVSTRGVEWRAREVDVGGVFVDK